MNTINKNEESVKVEFLKRVFYAFQVLIVGIALPLLFFVGISDGNQKKTTETQVKEISYPIQLSANPMVELYIPRI